MNNKLNDYIHNKFLMVRFNSNQRHLKLFPILVLISFNLVQCKKLVEIPPPVDTISTSEIFEKDDQATAAMSNIYFQLINSGQSFASYSTTLYAGMSADELNLLGQDFVERTEFERNDLQSTNSIVYSNFWSKAYFAIYSANAIIEGLTNYSGVTDSVKSELIGEAKFIRAFCNFYLVNLFGDIPLVNTTNWHNTNLISRTSSTEVYQNIINDLNDAENRLASDYSVGKGERIIPNKWAAKALLARTYLYKQDWTNAEKESSALINNSSQYSLLDNINNVFLKNSDEAIWQLKQSNSPTAGTNLNATPEGELLIPPALNSSYPPFAYLSSSLLGSFEQGDKRFTSWVDSTNYSGIVYYFPYKYKIGSAQASPGGDYLEYYMVLRLAEQFLIRSEARVNLNNLTEAISDLNKIRQRAGLNLLPNTLAKQEVLDAIEKERRIELFAEWGHRWLDLKRWGKADAVLGPVKGSNWQITDKLYPIPQSELIVNPNLMQNPGY